MTPKLCWQNGFAPDGGSTSCLLDADHEGDHEWTRDDQIKVIVEPIKPNEARYEQR